MWTNRSHTRNTRINSSLLLYSIKICKLVKIILTNFLMRSSEKVSFCLCVVCMLKNNIIYMNVFFCRTACVCLRRDRGVATFELFNWCATERIWKWLSFNYNDKINVTVLPANVCIYTRIWRYFSINKLARLIFLITWHIKLLTINKICIYLYENEWLTSQFSS